MLSFTVKKCLKIYSDVIYKRAPKKIKTEKLFNFEALRILEL